MQLLQKSLESYIGVMATVSQQYLLFRQYVTTNRYFTRNPTLDADWIICCYAFDLVCYAVPQNEQKSSKSSLYLLCTTLNECTNVEAEEKHVLLSSEFSEFEKNKRVDVKIGF